MDCGMLVLDSMHEAKLNWINMAGTHVNSLSAGGPMIECHSHGRSRPLGPSPLVSRIWGFPKIGVPLLGIPLRGFYSLWGIKRVPYFVNPHIAQGNKGQRG